MINVENKIVTSDAAAGYPAQARLAVIPFLLGAACGSPLFHALAYDLFEISARADNKRLGIGVTPSDGSRSRRVWQQEPAWGQRRPGTGVAYALVTGHATNVTAFNRQYTSRR